MAHLRPLSNPGAKNSGGGFSLKVRLIQDLCDGKTDVIMKHVAKSLVEVTNSENGFE